MGEKKHNNAEFDVYAKEYGEMHRQSIRISGEPPEFFAEYKVKDAARLIAKNVGFDANVRILDFGSGTGGSTPFFAKHLPKARLTCADVSSESLRIAQERFSHLAEYKLLDGEELPFPDASFDFVFSTCVFHHIPEIKHVDILREMHRVLRANGLIFIYEHNPYNPLTVRTVNSCPFDANAVLIKPKTLRDRINAAGFADIKSTFRLFFPGPLRVFAWFEVLLGWLPLGAQYYATGRKLESR